jgi:hypothetical protein
MTESFEDMVERIAKAWKEEPCPPEEGPGCNPDLHIWETSHPEDQDYIRSHVRFTLQQAGLG